MQATRRLSQAISEGDGISILVPVHDLGAARAAESQGAEGIVLIQPVAGVRGAVNVPIVWSGAGPPEEAQRGEADDEDPLERVLDLLPDVPAGKLAIAGVAVEDREDVLALERAGVDAVI